MSQGQGREFGLGKEYCYPTINGNAIRLLGISPGGQGDPLNCYFDIRDLQGQLENLRFVALSWRQDSAARESFRRVAMPVDPFWSDRVFITQDHSRSELPIHPSLLKALRHLRDVHEAVVVWVDQLCINYRDTNEAEVQLELIPEIFRRASEVMVWLGESSDDSTLAMQFIPDLLNLDLVDTLVKQESTPVKWRALINLMQRPYFSRRWVFLELMLAKRAVLYCGSHFVDWGDFADAVVILGSRYDEVKLVVRAAVSLEYVARLLSHNLSSISLLSD